MNFLPGISNISNTPNSSDENVLLDLLHMGVTFIGVVIFCYFCMLLTKKPGVVLENSESGKFEKIKELQHLLDLLLSKCLLLTKINEYEETVNGLFEQQLDSGVFELDSENTIKANNELQDLYLQLAQLDGGFFGTIESGESSPLQTRILDEIFHQTTLLKDLLEKHDEIKLAGLEIKRRQDIQISLKEIQIQRLKEQHESTKRPDTFFGRSQHAKEHFSDRESVNNLGNFQAMHSSK